MNTKLILVAALTALLAGCRPPCPKPECPKCVSSAPTVTLYPNPYISRGHRIVVARRDLPIGVPLRAGLLHIKEQPRGFVFAGHLRPVDIVHFAGMRLQRAIRRGEVVRRSDLLAASGALPPVKSLSLTSGFQAVTLPVDFVGGAGVWVEPGNVVDVALVAAEGSPSQLKVRVLLQGARVLAAERWRGAAPIRTARWCSVEVLPKEAQALALAQRLGRIVLFPRKQKPGRSADYPPVTRRQLEDPAFWERLKKRRLLKMKQRAPDDPGIRVK